MALNLLRLRGASVTASRPTFANVQRGPLSFGFRKFATSTTDDKTVVDPKQKAHSIIDSLPGNNIITKTGYITLGTGLTTFAISKELYVFNEETLILISFIGMCAVVYRGLRQPLAEYMTERAERINSVLRKARQDHKLAVQERIDSVSELGGVVDITKSLFALSKETAKLEAEAFELNQRIAATSEIKSVLDSWVRYETDVREREKRQLATTVIQKVKASLADPKMQDQLLEEAVVQVERLVK